MITIEDVSRTALASAESLLRRWLPAGVIEGNEYCVGSLAGEKGKSLKINLETGRWKDFATGDAGGDLVDLYAKINRVGLTEAKRDLQDELSLHDTPRPAPRPTAKDEGPAIIMPVPMDTDRPAMTIRGAHPSVTWDYLDAQGRLLFIVARYDNADGSKDIRPWILTGAGWTSKHPPVPRPLYGLNRLARTPGREVIIVEGEKAADALQQFKLGRPVITWSGGSSTVKRADWSPLKGRDVIIMPDADEPGIKAKDDVVAELAKVGVRNVRWIKPPKTTPPKWDAADAAADGWSKERMAAYLRDNIVDAAAPPGTDKARKMKEGPKKGALRRSLVMFDGSTMLADGAWLEELVWKNETDLARGIGNIMLFVENHPDLAGKIAFDEFATRIVWTEPPLWRNAPPDAPIEDADISHIRKLLERNGLLPGIQDTHEAVTAVAYQNIIDPLKDYLESLRWDGNERLNTWLTYYLGADDTPYHRAVGRRWMISGAARGLRAGCKADCMLVLEGKQGSKKSSAVRNLVPREEWFNDQIASFNNQTELAMSLQGSWIIEAAEMHALAKAEANKIKGILSTVEDKYRPPYGRNYLIRPRRCVFAGTTNEVAGYLNDATGGRRFWPVRCHTIDTDALAADRDQLWAEAVYLASIGEQHHLTEAENALATVEQDDRQTGFAWDNKFDEWLATTTGMLTTDAFLTTLSIPADSWERHKKTVAAMFTARGYRQVRRVDQYGKRPRSFVKDE